MSSFEYKKSLGQNFIKDENIIDKIVKYSEIDKNTLLIEIGPGAGSLSKKIVPLCGHAILYEIDERLRDTLYNVLGNNCNYEIIFGDFLEQDISNIRNKYNYDKIYVVANLPYYITTPIIIKLLNEIYPDKMVIMIQEEVANRLSASHGGREFGMISVLLGSRYDIKKLFKVSRNCFMPMPISLSKNDKMGNVDHIKFEKLIKDAFRFKRKNLKNNLGEYNTEIVTEVLTKYGYDLSNRAEDIPIDVFIEIAKKI